jgi:ribosomal protein L24
MLKVGNKIKIIAGIDKGTSSTIKCLSLKTQKVIINGIKIKKLYKNKIQTSSFNPKVIKYRFLSCSIIKLF